jgi:beta-galactosidase GanA
VLLVAAALAGVAATSAFPSFAAYRGRPYNVSYNARAVTLDGAPALFLSGSVHPPRGTPAMWDEWFELAVQSGLNMVQVYVFWNWHEEVEGTVDWGGGGGGGLGASAGDVVGQKNLTLFVQKAAAAGLFVNLRVGPYVCAEWSYGGLPAWLGLKPGVAFRQTNAVWQPAMERWFRTVVALMAAGRLFAPQGGPIVLVQVGGGSLRDSR